MKDTKVSVLTQRTTGQIAVVIRVGALLFDVPLSHKAARQLIRDMQEALGEQDN